MKHDIIKNIRKNNIKAFLVQLIFAAFFDFAFFGFLFNDEISEYWILLIFFGFMGGVMTYVCICTLLIVIDPYKSDIFKKYGNLDVIEKILDEIENTIEFQDEQIMIAKNYVADKRDYEYILAYKDILRVHKLVHKTNFVVDGYSVVITDKYKQEIKYNYSAKEEEKVNNLILLIGTKCENAKLGYTKEAEEHIKQNSVELPSEPIQAIEKNQNRKTKESYACPECRQIIEFEDKFCKNCGCKIDWT